MKKILLLLVAMLATTTVWATDFITDVMVIGGSKSEVNSLKTTYTSQGWTVIDQDLNAGCGSSSDYIYLLYKKASDGTSGATFITNFLISTSEGTAPNSFMDNGRVYYLVAYDGSTYFKNNKGDLNSHCGSGSATIHLYYTKDYADDLGTVKSIYFNDTQEGGVSVDGSTTGYDLNAGCGSSSDYIYMHAEKSQGWTYTKNASGTQCYINGYDGPKANITSITIPTTLDGAQVANFTGSVFSGFTNLETMIFNENTIVSQMPSVNGLTKFKNVKTSNSLGNNNTPPSMTSIPASTFEGTAVMVINLTSVTSIGNYAFKGCGNLKDVYVNSTLNNIGKQVFYNCSSLAHFWFNGTETQWNAVSKDSQWRNGASNFTEHWRCTVTFDANGHGTAPAAQTLWSNYEMVTEPTAPTAPLCTFQGWYTDAACTNQWNFNSIVTGDMTLYAKWNAKYTYNSATGALTLNWGEFNKDNKWGSDVPASAVTSVTATSQVSFTGDCSQLFSNFTNCTSMDLNSVNTSNATNMSSMFSGCNFLSTLNISNWDTGNVTNMSRMFSGCSCLTSLNVSNWNTSNVTDMSFMFQSCNAITTIDLSNWDIGKAFNMWNMFYGCDNLTTANLSGWDLSSNSVSISNLFSLCSNLKTVNLTGWKLGATNQIFCMFQNCRQLTTIYASTSWDASYINAPSTTKMFEGCTSLVGGMGTTFDENYTDKTYARIDRGATEPGYFTGVFTLTLPEDVTASPEPVCTLSGNKYYSAGTTVTLTYNGEVPEGKIVVFSVNGNPIEGRTFEMPLNDINITVTVTDPPRYTFNSETGELTLLWGEFNKDNKWGSDVPASAVKSVTATSQVSFTGDCSELFKGFTMCQSMDLDSINTNNVTNMSSMFSGCGALLALNISNWDTGNVTKMSRMFEFIVSPILQLDLSNWDTGNVTDMSFMFNNYHGSSLDLSGWNTSNVRDMNNMFSNSSQLSLLNISGWNTSNVRDMTFMFNACSNLKMLNLTGWDISNVIGLVNMFSGCGNLTTIYASTSWDAGNVEYSNNMFTGCSKLVGSMGTTFDENYIDKTYARIDLGTDEPGYLTGVFTLSLPGDVTASPEPVCTFGGADYYAAGSTVTLTFNGNVPEGQEVVYSVNGTAIEGNSFEMPLNDATVTVELQELRYTYDSATGALTLLRGEFNRSNKWGSDVPIDAVTSVTATSEVSFTGNCAELFRYFSNCTSMDLGNVNTSTVTDMAAMFNSCPKLETLNVVGWNTGNVTTTNAMFYGCSSLNSIDVSGWNTGKLSNMSGMFYGCSSLTSLDLSGWTTSSVTTMAALFLNCSNLTTIYVVEDWDLGHLYDSDGMFYGCTSLVGGKGTTYDQNHINSEYARIDGGPNRPGYFTDKNSVVVVTGDVDGDGYVTTVDITAIYNYLLNGDMTYFDTSDVDGDGYITTTDITVIYNILLGN